MVLDFSFVLLNRNALKANERAWVLLSAGKLCTMRFWELSANQNELQRVYYNHRQRDGLQRPPQWPC